MILGPPRLGAKKRQNHVVANPPKIHSMHVTGSAQLPPEIHRTLCRATRQFSNETEAMSLRRMVMTSKNRSRGHFESISDFRDTNTGHTLRRQSSWYETLSLKVIAR